MTTYSVWNGASRRFDYYEAPGDSKTHAGAPPRVESNALGATPEQAAWPLPAMAIKVGSGELARGRIASLAGDREGSGFDVKRALVYGAIGYLLWKVLL